MMSNFKDVFEKHFTWIEGFLRNVQRFASKTALVDPSTQREWNYRELNNDTNRLCNALLESGIKRNDTIMLFMENCPEFVFSYITAHKLQAVCCPVNYRLSPGEFAYIINESKPFVIITNAHLKSTLRESINRSIHRPNIMLVTDCESECDMLSYEQFTKDCSAEEPMLLHDYNIYNETTRLYTSGTTGKPKAVPLTSINEVLSAHDVMIHFPMSHKDITMNTTPWFHRGGLHCAGPCPSLYAGSSMIVLRNFNPQTTLEYIVKHKITFIVGVPTILENLADIQEVLHFDLSTLKGIVTMGSPLEKNACIRYQRVLNNNIFNGYGTTETFWNTFLRPFDLPENAGSAGGSCIDDDVRVVKHYDSHKAEPDELVACDGIEVGEVIICSPAKSPYTYFENEEGTKEKIYKDFIYTGDLATWDENRFVTIIGRKDDMIISSGENIYPTEIESILHEHPKVKDCIVTAVPDKVRGQVVTAYIVKNDESLTPEEIDEFCKSNPNLSKFKRPRYYRFIEQIPYNSTGKKLHVIIRQIAENDLNSNLLYKV